MIQASQSIVRKAIAADIPEIWRLFLMGHRENGMFILAPSKVDMFLNRAIYPDQVMSNDTGPRGQIAVIGSPGRLEALVFVILGSYWYSEEIHLEELIVYVDPEYRASNHAKACIQWMKNTADDLGIKLVTGIMSTDRTQAKIRLYDRYLPRVGAFFLYPIGDLNVKRQNHNMEKEAWLAAKRV
jgi:GNAT superfamily N-acetyltransferase